MRPTLLPGDPVFREAMRSYMRWAVDDVLSYPGTTDVSASKAMPRWNWDGLQA